jgi:hypothetical protein
MRTLAFLLLTIAPGLVAAHAQASSFGSSQKRELIIFAPSVRNLLFKQQVESLTHSRNDLRDRDLQVVLVLGSASEADLKPFSSDDLFILLNSRDESEQSRDFHVAPHKFTIILIGKDGGEKLRQHTPIPVEKLNATIDAMPMRRDEMRQKK